MIKLSGRKKQRGDALAEIKKNRRLYIFDNIKFILMALVVVGHYADVGASVSEGYRSLYVFIYSFHMPLFLFLSGLFHKNTKILQKTVTFVSLGFLSKLLIYLTRLILFKNAAFNFFADGGLPWFMFVLAMFIGVSYLLRNVDKKIVLGVSVLVALIAGYISSVGDFLYLSRFFVFYPFYLLGMMTPKIVLINLNKMKAAKIISAAVLIIWFVICFTQIDTIYPLRYLFTGRNSFMLVENFKVWGFFWRIVCYLITVIVSLAVICIAPRKKLEIISDFGKNTLQVYFWQTTVLLILRKIGLAAWLIEYPFGRFVWLVIGLGVTFLLSTKYFSFPTKQVSKLCGRIQK